MWKAYFRRSRIVGIDIYEKSPALKEDRIDIRQCNQTDSEALQRLSDEYGGFDIIIDDGSHLNADVIKTFQILFPVLRNKGIYAIEDTQTSYWSTWGGGIDSAQSSMRFFKSLVDGLNYAEFPIPNYKPNYFEKHIVQIIFLHNLVFIFKGVNDEPTNALPSIEREIRLRTRKPANI
jgi:demethylmacrocin O-methyltransferase